MNTKKTSFAMLGIGLAVGILVGYSLNDRPITAEESAYLRERESLRAAKDRFSTTYQMADVKLLEVIPSNTGVIQLPLQKPLRFAPELHPYLKKHQFRSPDLDQDGDLIDLRPSALPKDLIDQRYTPPHIEMR